MNTRNFSGRILVLGAGGVSQCTLPLILRHITVDPGRITVIDMLDKREILKPILDQGVTFIQEEIKRATYKEQFAKYLSKGDMLIDLAWNIEATDILQWCHDNDVLYINTSVELWDPYNSEAAITDRTLYVRHMAIRKMMNSWSKPGATAILEHGANPGLVSHFTRMGLIDIGNKVMETSKDVERNRIIRDAIDARAYPKLAQTLGVKAIHISEIDTQVTNQPRAHDEFVNTWSVEGFYEEGTAPAEMGWGTHEERLPSNAHTHNAGPQNQVCLESFGMDTFVRSRVPSQNIVGMVVRHGESFTLSDSLTQWEGNKAVYRPTVHYAYQPCEEALDSLRWVRNTDYAHPDKYRIMEDDIQSGGVDELGVLLMGHDFKSWWIGTILSIDETRKLVPGQNATTLQVAGSIIAAVMWMIDNPERGVLIPDQIPHEELMPMALPYLGETPSMPIDWAPVPTTKNYSYKDSAPWQFENFVIPTLDGRKVVEELESIYATDTRMPAWLGRDQRVFQ